MLTLLLAACTPACNATPSPGTTNAGVLGGDPQPTGADPDPTPPATAAPSHHRCAWLFTNDPTAAAAFTAHADRFDAIHPVWFALASDGVDPDDAAKAQSARAHGMAGVGYWNAGGEPPAFFETLRAVFP